MKDGRRHFVLAKSVKYKADHRIFLDVLVVFDEDHQEKYCGAAEGNRVMNSVTNDNMSILDEQKSKVFEMFYIDYLEYDG